MGYTEGEQIRIIRSNNYNMNEREREVDKFCFFFFNNRDTHTTHTNYLFFCCVLLLNKNILIKAGAHMEMTV